VLLQKSGLYLSLLSHIHKKMSKQFAFSFLPRIIALAENCIVHRSLTVEAVQETQRLLSKGLSIHSENAVCCVVPAFDDVLEEIIGCLWTQKSMSLDSPERFLLGGSGCVVSTWSNSSSATP